MATTGTGLDTPPQLPHHKVKYKKPAQRACNEKDAKGKLCGGHLKRWFYADDVIEQACGDVEKAWGADDGGLPLRALQDALLAQSRGSRPAATLPGREDFDFGLTLPPKRGEA